MTLAHLVYQHWFITCILMLVGAYSVAVATPTIRWKKTYQCPTCAAKPAAPKGA